MGLKVSTLVLYCEFVMNDNWALLNLDPTGDALAIKRAYAKQLKQNRPDDAPEAYQALRHAYEWVHWVALVQPRLVGPGLN